MHFIRFVIVVAILVTFIIGYYMRTKNQERISLIEKGINPDEGHSISEYRKQTSLKNGVLFIAFGLGLFFQRELNHTSYFANNPFNECNHPVVWLTLGITCQRGLLA